MKLGKALVFTLVFIANISARAQQMVYRNDTSWKVFAYNQEKTLGFSGGFNNPQFGAGDLNNDGRIDLVVFEKGSKQIKTFINYGTAGNPDYRYRAQFEKFFPEENGQRSVEGYMIMEDFNCDQIPDLLTRGSSGFSIYFGYYAQGALHFNFIKDLYYSKLTAFPEDFENAGFPKSVGWKIMNTGGKGWGRVTSGTQPSATPQSGSAMMMFNAHDMSANNTALLVSKKFRISPNLKSEGKISFWIYRDAASAGDSISVFINDDTTLVNAVYIGGVARCRTLPVPDVKSADGWYSYTFSLPFHVVGNALYFIFKGTSQSGNNIFLDNVYGITSPLSGDVNAYIDPGGDIPGIGDPDKDGDMDFFAFNITGGYINFYKNYQKEENLPCDSIHINLKDGCWGKVYQGTSIHQTLGTSCSSWQPPLPPAKVTHTGNTLCMLDYDGDGDLDYLNGGVSYTNIQYLENGKADYGYAIDTIITQDTTWQSGGKIYSTSQFPAAFHIDIDQDGKKDILVSPSAEAASENYHGIAYYKNTGTASSPSFTYQHDSLLVEETIDMGTGSYPMLYDYNKDGKPDLFVGGDGYFQPDGSFRAQIAYYENTSSGGVPSFSLQNNDFLNTGALNIKGAYPAAGDLDNDGLDDLVVGHANGTISFYKNMAASATAQPQWQLAETVLKDVNNVSIDSAQYAAPFIYDMDKDGKSDLLIGGISGVLFYYKNTGGTSPLALQYQTNFLGAVKADPWNFLTSYSVPFVGKIDNSNTDYLVLGSHSGRLSVFTGFQNGNVSAPYTLLDSALSGLNVNLGYYSGFRAAPAFADLNGDGMHEMVLGNVLGGVTIFHQVAASVVHDFTKSGSGVRVYPNPAKDKIYIGWENSFIQSKQVAVKITNVSGQELIQMFFAADSKAAFVNTNTLAPGIYFCEIRSGKNRTFSKIVILK